MHVPNAYLISENFVAVRSLVLLLILYRRTTLSIILCLDITLYILTIYNYFGGKAGDIKAPIALMACHGDLSYTFCSKWWAICGLLQMLLLYV